MRVEWPTVCLIAGCYMVWGLGLWAASIWVPLAIIVLAVTIALQSSLQHEVIHGHPFRATWASDIAVMASLNLVIPFLRFRDMHLAHHQDANLTDPYDDPETAYMDPGVWDRLWPGVQWLLRMNNTLAGRLVLGPAIAQAVLMYGDWRQMRAGTPGVARAWVLHGLAVMPVIALVAVSDMPIWAYLMACYTGLSILKIRTFAEHQAHEHTGGRTVVIEDRGLFAFLFLNNNFHVVHHMHPDVAWYRLPALYFANRPRYLARNFGYTYRSYGQVIARYFWRAKEPVAHPLYRPR